MSELSSIADFSEDLSNAKPPVPLPAKDYTMEVRFAEVGLSKSGKRMLTLSFYLPPDAYPADYKEGNPDGTTLKHYTVIEDTPQGRWNAKRIIDNLGGTLGRSIDPNSLIGLRARVTVKQEDFEGVMQARADKVGKIV